MTAWRQAVGLSIGEDDLAKSKTRSRTEPASRVERARMLLVYRGDSSFFAVGHVLGAHHQTVQRCVERAAAAVKAGKKLEDFSIASPAKKTAARKVGKSAK